MDNGNSKPALDPKANFLDKYKKLVADEGFEIVARPQYLLRDDGSYSLVIVFDIVPVKKPEAAPEEKKPEEAQVAKN